MYIYNEVFEATKEYFGGDEFPAKVCVDKYLLRDNDGNFVERTPDDMHRRIAKEIARIEKNKFKEPYSEDFIYDCIKNFGYIIPQGSSLFGIGNLHQYVTLSNCYVVDSPIDSYGGILHSDQQLVNISKRRGGVGLDLNNLRPEGSSTKNSSRSSTGILSWMTRYSNSIREVGQNASRGALMLTISVHHPQVLDFAKAKLDNKKVTGANVSIRLSDEFLSAVENDGVYEQRWPEENPKISRKVNAREVWQEIIKCARDTGEPGLIFWSNILQESPADCYENFKTISTNPCLTAETLVYVADGRGLVSIKELADIGDDVKVFCLDDKHRVCIKTMRHPRVTGFKEAIYKITLDDGTCVRCTTKHKFLMKNGNYQEVVNLNVGDSLDIITRFEASLKDIFPDANSSSQNYIWINSGQTTSKTEHRLIAEYFYGKIPTGEKNARYIDVSNEEIIEHAKILTKKLGRRFSIKEWAIYTREHNLPTMFTDFRKNILGDIKSFSKKIALSLGFIYVDFDPRLLSTYNKMIESGYNAKIINNRVFVERGCEICHNHFWVEHGRREMSFCNMICVAKHLQKPVFRKKSQVARLTTEANLKIKKKEQQLIVFNNLKQEFGREPLQDEWEYNCKQKGIPFRIGKHSPFKKWTDLKEEATNYNHKVVKIEFDGYEDVFNGTVDDHHNFLVGGFLSKQENNKNKWHFLISQQCGEIPLCSLDSCRLLLLNLFKFVENPFTSSAYFDYVKYYKYAQIAERLMDDIIDLELDSIDRII